MNSNYFERFCSFIVKPHIQVMVLLVTFIIVAISGDTEIEFFEPLEKRPDIISITPAKIKQWGGDPTVVDVGLYIQSWQEFDVLKNSFTFDGILWFQFDPALISLDTVDKFSFEKGDIEHKSEAATKLIDGKLFAEYKVRVHFNSELSFRFFPIDDHRVYLVLVNTSVTPGEMVFNASKSTFASAESILIPDWDKLDTEATPGYGEQNIDKFDNRKLIRYPKVVFTLDFTRSGVSLIVLIFLPIFLIFFISLFSLSLDPAQHTTAIMTLTTSALTSIIAYRFVIQGMSPKVGYFIFSDFIFTFFLALSFVNFIGAVLLMRYGKLTPFVIKARGCLFIFFHVFVITVWLYFMFLWGR